MKNPLPLLIVVALGGLMMSRKKQTSENPDEAVPTTLDYDNPKLHQALKESTGDNDPEDDYEDDYE